MVLILTTVPSLKTGRQLARTLLDRHLAACVSLSKALESHFVWKRKRRKAREYFLWIKTRKTCGKKVEVFLLENHPYEVPEVLFLPVTHASASYLQWVKDSTR